MSHSLQVRLLGPVEADVDGRPLDGLDVPQLRALLAALALTPRTVVSIDALTEALWDEPPPSPAEKLQTYVAALQRVLEPEATGERWATLRAQDAGYVLDTPRGNVDALRFAAALSAARAARAAGDQQTAIARFTEALDEWRGAALADIDDAPIGRSTAVSLEEQRRAALAERDRAKLALESEHAPAPASGADWPSGVPTPEDTGATDRRRNRRVMAIVIGAAVLLTVAVARTDDPAPVEKLRSGAVGLIDLRQGSVVEQVELGEDPSALLVDNRVLWVALPGRGVLASTDAGNPASVSEITLSPGTGGAAAAAGAIWVAQTDDGIVVGVNVRTRGIVHRVTVGGRPGAVATAGGSVWVANRLDGSVSRIDPERGTVVRTVSVGRDPIALTAAADALWVANAGDSTLTRISLPDGEVTRQLDLAGSPSGVLVAHGSVWVTYSEAGTVVRLDPGTGRVRSSASVGTGVTGLVATAEAVIASSGKDGRLWVLAPTTGQELHRVTLGSAPLILHSDGTRVWAGSSGRTED